MNRKEIRLEFLRRDLQKKEAEKVKVWESFWWILWIFLPVIGWIIMIIIVFSKISKKSKLDKECGKIRDEVRELQNELLEEKISDRQKF